MLQAVKGRDQVAVAGAAGFYFFYSVGKLYHFPGLGNRSAGVAIKGTDFYLADVGAANTKGGSLCDIGPGGQWGHEDLMRGNGASQN